MKPFSLPYTFTLTLLLAVSITSCGLTAKPMQSLVILPQDCSMPISKQTGLTLSGQIDPNSKIAWQTDFGSIVQNAQGLSATYIAPAVPGEAQVTATVTSGVNASSMVLTVKCKVQDTQSTASNSNAPISSSSGTGLLSTEKPTVIISEMMGNPCGGIDQRKYNQYVELYNYGDQPVDVGGWWLYDEGDIGTPDKLVAWNARSAVQISEGLVLNSTVIPPQSVAVVLSPQYPQNLDISKMPYRFPPNVIILSVAESDTLGDDYFGFIADQDGYDTLTLYKGGASIIDQVVDTYGTPSILSAYPVEIKDDHNDNIPMYLSDCHSIERIDPNLPDEQSNWKSIPNGTPGEVPFG